MRNTQLWYNVVPKLQDTVKYLTSQTHSQSELTVTLDGYIVTLYLLLTSLIPNLAFIFKVRFMGILLHYLKDKCYGHFLDLNTYACYSDNI